MEIILNCIVSMLYFWYFIAQVTLNSSNYLFLLMIFNCYLAHMASKSGFKIPYFISILRARCVICHLHSIQIYALARFTSVCVSWLSVALRTYHNYKQNILLEENLSTCFIYTKSDPFLSWLDLSNIENDINSRIIEWRTLLRRQEEIWNVFDLFKC